MGKDVKYVAATKDKTTVSLSHLDDIFLLFTSCHYTAEKCVSLAAVFVAQGAWRPANRGCGEGPSGEGNGWPTLFWANVGLVWVSGLARLLPHIL